MEFLSFKKTSPLLIIFLVGISFTSFTGVAHACTNLVGPNPAACSTYAGSYGIPSTDTMGNASYTYDSCTYAITAYTGGCYAPTCANGGLSGATSCPTCANGGLSGASCPTGSWTSAPSCPTACGTGASTTYGTCTGGNGYCSGSAPSQYCSATAACYVAPVCTQVQGTNPAACSTNAGSYGIPSNYTVGNASYTYDSCTYAVTYTGGCSAPWSAIPACPTGCGLGASTKTATCSGGTGTCSGSAPTNSCLATAACVFGSGGSATGSPWTYNVSWEGYNLDFESGNSYWMPAGSVAEGTFTAYTNQSTYAPGEAISITLGAVDGAPGNCSDFGLFGCQGTHGMSVTATLGSSSVTNNQSANWTVVRTLTAPSAPGAYSIALVGGWYVTDQYTAQSSIDITVGCPSGTSNVGGSCLQSCSSDSVNGCALSPTSSCSSSSASAGTCASSASSGTCSSGYGTCSYSCWDGVWSKVSNSCTTAPGVCGTANGKTYPSDATGYSPDTQCSAGVSSNTTFPAAGSSAAWLCNNNGNYSPMCQAWRSAAVAAPGTCTAPSGATITLSAGSTCPTWTKYCTPYNDANPYQEWAYSNPYSTSSYWDHVSSEDWKCAWTPDACLTTCGASYPQTYTCGATSPGCGTNGASATCTRSACTSAPTVTLNAFSPSSITVGQSSSISFSSTNADSCSGSGFWNGDLGGTSSPGSSTGPMNTAGTYTQSVTCSGSGGSATSVTRSLTVGAPTSCSATTVSNCDLSPVSSGGSSGSCSSGYTSGACSYFCSNGVWSMNSNSCAVANTYSCGTANGTPQLSSDPSGAAACSVGTYANSPADTTTSGSQAWNWSCGTVTTCSSPKYGCRTTTDSNYTLSQYGASGPNNTWGCANTCANGATNYPTCNAFSSCPTTTVSNCALSPTSSGGSSGSCSSGYDGACSYSCFNGSWSMSSNSCAVPLTCDALPSGGANWNTTVPSSSSWVSRVYKASDPGTSVACTYYCDSTHIWDGGKCAVKPTDCSLDGTTIISGYQVTASTARTATSPATCASISQIRHCTDGNLDGTYPYVGCTQLAPTIDSFTVAPMRVRQETSVTIKWRTTDVTSCVVKKSGSAQTWSGKNSPAGGISDTVTGQTTYTITCDSLPSKSVLVNVVPFYKEF